MKIFMLTVIFATFSLYAQSEMTAEDAIRIGLKNNFEIRIARNNVQIAENNISKGTGGFLPVLDATGGYQSAISDQETNSPFSFGKSTTRDFSGQITLNWTVFDGFQMFINRSRYKTLAELGFVQAREIIESTVLEILRAYFNLVQQEQLLDVAKNSLAISETRLNKQKVRREVGGASSTDLLNAQVSYNNDRATMLNQELQVIVVRKELNKLLARDPLIPVKVKKEISIPDLSLDLSQLQEIAEKRNSDLMIARHNETVAKQNLNIAKSVFSPKLSVNGSYGYVDRLTSSDTPRFPDDIETQSTDASLSLNLSLNLFNGFRNKVDLHNARIEFKNRKLALRNSQIELDGLVHEKYETFKTQVSLVELEEENVFAAKRNLQLQQDRYEIGTASSLEFRDAQVNLIRAQTTMITARFQAKITHLEIQKLIGNIEIE